MGTLSYMSPEQARGRELDPRSDIFSLGIVLYEMVTGELPFKGETPLDTMHAIAFEEVRPVTILRKNLPPEVHRIVSRALRKKPEDRYPDARALVADLKRLKQDIESGTKRALPAGQRFREWLNRSTAVVPFGNKGAIILVLVVVAAVVLLVLRVNWGGLIFPACVALLIYRAMRNKKRQLIGKFVKKISELPDVRAVIVQEDRVTVIADRTPASLYLRVTSLIEALNKRLFVGKHVEAQVRDDVSEDEFKGLLRKTGVVYVRGEAPEVPKTKKPRTGIIS
jgi:hypothetical protein